MLPEHIETEIEEDMIIAGTMEERQVNRLKKSMPKSRLLIPEHLRTPCLRCNGVAKMDNVWRMSYGDSGSRYCDECGFGWEYRRGIMSHSGGKDGFWTTIPRGLMPIWWEKECVD